LTLVELMIGLTLGLLVTVGLLGVYLSVSRTNTELAKSNAQIENGRFAIQFLRDDISAAGFWGGYVPKFDNLTYSSAVPDDVPTDVPDPCLAFTSWPTDAAVLSAYQKGLLGIGIQAYDAVPATCATLINDRQANTDILVVRHADTCEAGVGTCPAMDGTSVYFQASRLGSVNTGTTAAPVTAMDPPA
jgi:type IV pilus assembly protein PilW